VVKVAGFMPCGLLLRYSEFRGFDIVVQVIEVPASCKSGSEGLHCLTWICRSELWPLVDLHGGISPKELSMPAGQVIPSHHQ
jgi:hypothetical protein